jgi:hypothetical protein
MQNPHRKPSPETQKLIDDTKAWMSTAEGQERIREVMRVASIASRKFREDSRVDPATLRIPMDV